MEEPSWGNSIVPGLVELAYHFAADRVVVKRHPKHHRAFWGAVAYAMHRRGMREILERFWPGGADGPPFEELKTGMTEFHSIIDKTGVKMQGFDFSTFGKLAVADYVPYARGNETYFASRPLFTSMMGASALHEANLLGHEVSHEAVRRVLYPANGLRVSTGGTWGPVAGVLEGIRNKVDDMGGIYKDEDREA